MTIELYSGSLKQMNEPGTIRLISCMRRPEAWGREEGRIVYPCLLHQIESQPGTMIFRVSMFGVVRVDMSFISETVVQLARRYRGHKGFCFVDMTDDDMIENCDAAATKAGQPLLVWRGGDPIVIGPRPSPGTLDAFQFALAKPCVRVADFVNVMPNVSVTNASNKFKQLWQQGYLLRREQTAETGGLEFVYQRIA